MSKYLDLKSSLLDKAAKNHLPAVVEFEIIAKCNLDCQMCYLKGIHHEAAPSLLDWIELFQETVKSGMLYATLTGGEIFLSPDFIELYNALYDMGVKISLFTNGTILTPSIEQCLLKRPPELIALTLYGASEETYELVTTQRMHSLIFSNLARMKQLGLPVLVRTIPIKPVFDELDSMIQQVSELGLSLGYYLYLSVGNEYAKKWRLSPKELIEFESKIRNAFPAYLDKVKSKGFHDCNALKNSCFVDHRMNIRPCSTAPIPFTKYEPGKFLSQFHELSKEWDALEVEACHGCSFQDGCISCKARLLLEKGIQECSPYLSDIAKRRMP
ncbi:MAG: radical SAM protein [Candidatus Izemoplasmatales bacterium]|nr:radical SAM protein [Candidatus Izemoplasmatales bacterium]